MLLKYVKVNKVVFPIEKVKYLSNVKILNDCIDNQIIYNPNHEMIKNITLLEDKDLKEIYPLIKKNMDTIDKIFHNYNKNDLDSVCMENLHTE